MRLVVLILSAICERHHVACQACVKVVTPGLHHLGSRLQVHGVVVRGANLIALLVSQLQLDVLVWPTLLVQ